MCGVGRQGCDGVLDGLVGADAVRCARRAQIAAGVRRDGPPAGADDGVATLAYVAIAPPAMLIGAAGCEGVFRGVVRRRTELERVRDRAGCARAGDTTGCDTDGLARCGAAVTETGTGSTKTPVARSHARTRTVVGGGAAEAGSGSSESLRSLEPGTK